MLKNNKCFEDLKNCYTQNYDRKTWITRERLFISCCRQIDLKLDTEFALVKELLYKLDVVFTQAKLDLAIVSKKLEHYNNEIDDTLKLKALEARNKGFATNDTSAKAYAIKVIKKDDAYKDNKGRTLYDYRDIYAARYAFLSQITEIIKMKQQMLITASSMFKLEASLVQ